jgi:Domain of unknown function (DUF4258)
MMAAVPLLRETGTLRSVIADPGFHLILTTHGRKEMAADDIIEPDVRRVLEWGTVTWIETKQEELWHVEGKDIDGRSIRLVVVVYPDAPAVKLVTAMEL